MRCGCPVGDHRDPAATREHNLAVAKAAAAATAAAAAELSLLADIKHSSWKWVESALREFLPTWGFCEFNYSWDGPHSFKDNAWCGLPCVAKTCAVRPGFALLVGELRPADPSKVQGAMRQC